MATDNFPSWNNSIPVLLVPMLVKDVASEEGGIPEEGAVSKEGAVAKEGAVSMEGVFFIEDIVISVVSRTGCLQ